MRTPAWTAFILLALALTHLPPVQADHARESKVQSLVLTNDAYADEFVGFEAVIHGGNASFGHADVYLYVDGRLHERERVYAGNGSNFTFRSDWSGPAGTHVVRVEARTMILSGGTVKDALELTFVVAPEPHPARQTLYAREADLGAAGLDADSVAIDVPEPMRDTKVVVVCPVSGAILHVSGAAGVLETAVCTGDVMVLRTQALAPEGGLRVAWAAAGAGPVAVRVSAVPASWYAR